jgi:S-adenosylhomocysteine hydrolase
LNTRNAQEYHGITLKTANGLHVLGKAACNLAVCRRAPVEIKDMSFGIHALCARI